MKGRIGSPPCASAGTRGFLRTARIALARATDSGDASTNAIQAALARSSTSSNLTRRVHGRTHGLDHQRTSRWAFASLALSPSERARGSLAPSREGSGRRRCGRDGWFAAISATWRVPATCLVFARSGHASRPGRLLSRSERSPARVCLGTDPSVRADRAGLLLSPRSERRDSARLLASQPGAGGRDATCAFSSGQPAQLSCAFA